MVSISAGKLIGLIFMFFLYLFLSLLARGGYFAAGEHSNDEKGKTLVRLALFYDLFAKIPLIIFIIAIVKSIH